MDVLPAGTTHVMWYHKSTKPTQFGKTLAKIGDGAMEVTKVVTMTTLLIGGTYVYVVLVGWDDHDSGFSGQPTRDQHKHRRHH